MVEITCQQCGELFTAKNKTQKFCSHQCYWKSKIKFVKTECPICKKEFLVKPFEIKNGPKYCSLKCNIDSQRNTVEKTCVACGEKFKVQKYRETLAKYCSDKCRLTVFSKNNTGKGVYLKSTCLICGKTFDTYPHLQRDGRGKYCSKKCFAEGMKGRFVGENNPGWKGGLSFGKYCPKFNDEFKERVRGFFNRTCMMCGKPEKDNSRRLPVHHVNYEKMVCCDDIAPLFLPLCDVCHAKTNFNRDYWEYVLTEFVMVWFDGESYLPK